MIVATERETTGATGTIVGQTEEIVVGRSPDQKIVTEVRKQVELKRRL